MAKRFVYIVNQKTHFQEKIEIEFQWFPGFSISQKQKSIADLHLKFGKKYPNHHILEVSSKSTNEVGIQASAFNLNVPFNNKLSYTIEQLFQASKVYKHADSQWSLLEETKDSLEIKRINQKINQEDELIGFKYFNREFPLEPNTYFYNWLYVNSLALNQELSNAIYEYNVFTDIEFNPKKSINCQAEACSIYVSLRKRNLLDEALKDESAFLEIVYPSYENHNMNEKTTTGKSGNQLNLFHDL